MIYFNKLQTAEIMNDITSIHCWEETLNRWSAGYSQHCPDLGTEGLMRKWERATWCCWAAHCGLRACKAPGPTWYPDCALMLHYTLAVTIPADSDITSSHCCTPLQCPSTQLWKLQHSTLLEHKAHAAKITKSKLFVTRRGSNSVSWGWHHAHFTNNNGTNKNL